jgi:hypothetical protein
MRPALGERALRHLGPHQGAMTTRHDHDACQQIFCPRVQLQRPATAQPIRVTDVRNKAPVLLKKIIMPMMRRFHPRARANITLLYALALVQSSLESCVGRARSVVLGASRTALLQSQCVPTDFPAVTPAACQIALTGLALALAAVANVLFELRSRHRCRLVNELLVNRSSHSANSWSVPHSALAHRNKISLRPGCRCRLVHGKADLS